MAQVPPQNYFWVDRNSRHKWASRIWQGAVSPSFGPLARVPCWSLLGLRPGDLQAPNSLLFSSHLHLRIWVLLRFILSSNSVTVSSVCETTSRNQVCLIASPVLACVLDCACRDKPSWRGHSCDMGDNQWSSGVVIAGFCSFGTLDHQRRVLHQSSLPYLSEVRDSTSYQVASVIRLPVRYYRVTFRLIFVPRPKVQKKP
jgi:hypothetical protein